MLRILGYMISVGASPKNCTSQKVSFLAFKLLGELPWRQVSERAVVLDRFRFSIEESYRHGA